MIADAARAELAHALGRAIQFDVPSARLTSLRVGGIADALAAPPDRLALAQLLRLCAKHRLPSRVIGRGFNTIVRDEGVDGVLIQLARLKQLAPNLNVVAEVSAPSASTATPTAAGQPAK